MATPGTLLYPTQKDNLDSLIRTGNNLSTTLAVAIDTDDTSLTVSSTSGFPNSGAITVDDEIIYYESKDSTHFLQCTRLSGAISHSVSAPVEMRIIARHHDILAEAILEIENKLGKGASLPSDSVLQILRTDAGGNTGWVDFSVIVDDVSSDLSSALVHITGNETIAGTKTFSSPVVIPVGVGGSDAVNLTQLSDLASTTATADSLLDGRLSTVETGLIEVDGRLDTLETGGGTTSLDGLTDAVISTPADSQYLRFNGSEWVNSAIQAADLPVGIDVAKLGNQDINNTILSYLNSVTSDVQIQLNNRLDISNITTARTALGFVTDVLPTWLGGTGLSGFSTGYSILYSPDAVNLSVLPGNVNGNRKFLISTGNGSTATGLSYDLLSRDDVPDFIGAAAFSNGERGGVPAPSMGQEGFWLRGDSTWQPLDNFEGASSSANGVAGLVPQPMIGEEDYFLKASGGWAVVTPTGPDELDELTDVTLTGLADNNILSYDLDTGLWTNVVLTSSLVSDFSTAVYALDLKVGTAARTIGVNRNTSGTGNSLVLQAGGAQAGTSNSLAGNLILSSGQPTGNASSTIYFQVPDVGSSGTTDATMMYGGKLNAGGRWSFGGNFAATAYAHLAASKAAAGYAPLKFTTTSAVLLTTPETGVVEVDSSGNLYYTHSGARYFISLNNLGNRFTPNGNSYSLTDGSTIAINWQNGNAQYVTLGGNRTITFANPVENGRYVVILTQDATGSRTITWPAGIKWAGGSAPVLTTTGTKADIVTFLYMNGTYYGDWNNNF
jgi:hypothetical protein